MGVRGVGLHISNSNVNGISNNNNKVTAPVRAAVFKHISNHAI